MGVKVREKRGKLYLDIYHGGKRSWESLHMSLTKDKEQDKKVRRLAEICRSQRESQLLAGAWNIQDPLAGKMKFITYAERRAGDYSNPSTMKSFLCRLKKFKGGDAVLISRINSKWVADFQRHLEKDSGLALMSAAHYSKILRATLKKAVADNVIVKSPAERVPPLNAPEADMVFLNADELQRLADAGVEGRGAEIKRAFLVACYTGLRVVDLETLTWGQIETNPMQIIKRQVKTKEPVYIPVNGTVKKIIGDGAGRAPSEKVFNLPHKKRRQSYSALKQWAKAAGINKNIGWHTARRTFATQALENGADIYTVSKLLGHKSLKQTEKYAKVTDRLRREAVAALPEISLPYLAVDCPVPSGRMPEESV